MEIRDPTDFLLTVGATLMLLSGAACSEAGGGANPGPVVSDSSGVRIVAYPGEPVPSHDLSVSTEPTLRHGHGDGDYTFQRIGHGALDAEGRAVVYDMGTGDLVRIDADGRLDTVMARRGRGPEEVLQARSIHVLEDGGVLVEDMGNGKIMVFREGVPTRSFSTMADPEVSRGLMIEGFDASGAPLMVTAQYNPRFEEPWLQGHMIRLDLATMTPDTVAAFDMAMRRIETEPQSPWGSFGRATVARGSFVHARTDVPEIRWRRADGRVRQILRWDPVWRYPVASDWDEFAESFLEDMRRANPQLPRDEALRFAREQLERFELRTDEPYPLFSDLRSDDEGRVWLGDFDHRGWSGIEGYRVIAPDGTWLGRVTLPSDFRVLDIRGGRILGVSRDELDVEGVAVHDFVVEPRAGEGP